MTRKRWLVLCPAWLALALAAPAPAAEESRIKGPLAQVPAKAPIVVYLHGLKRTSDRLVTMVKNALPDLGPQLQTKLKDFFREGMFEGRKLKGLKDDGPVFLVFTELPRKGDEAPKMALILGVTDYKAFRDGFLKEEERKELKEDKEAGFETATFFGKETYFINRKGYAVLAQDKEVARALAKPVKGKGLEGWLDPKLAKKLLGSDLAAYVDMGAVNESYGKQIKAGFDFVGVALDRLPDAGALDKSTVEIFKALIGGLHQAIQDSKSFVLAADFRPDGFALQARVDVFPKSKSNAVLKTMKPSALKELGTLPAHYTTFTAADFGPDALKALEPVVKKIFAQGDDEEEDEKAKARTKEVQEAIKDLLAAKPRRVLAGGTLGSQSAGLQIWDYADPAKAAAAQLKLYKTLTGSTKYLSMPLKGKPTIKANAVAYRSGKLNHVKMDWDLDKLLENAGGAQAAKLVKQFLGEGLNLWFGAVDKQYVQVTAKDWKAAKRDLDRYFAKKDEIGNPKHKAFARARKHLPREASALSLVSVPKLAQVLAQYIYEAMKVQGLPVGEPGVPLKKAPVSYLGYGVTLQAGHGSFDLWIPGASARDFRRAFEPIFKPLTMEDE
jgi:hypothetical protein